MEIIDYEIEEIKKIVERVINNSKIIVCMNTLVIRLNAHTNLLQNKPMMIGL